jgi:hypothetical protein
MRRLLNRSRKQERPRQPQRGQQITRALAPHHVVNDKLTRRGKTSEQASEASAQRILAAAIAL